MNTDSTPAKPRPHSRLLTRSTKFNYTDDLLVDERARAAGLTRSAYIRQAAVTGQVQPRVVIPQINQRQWIELGKMGGNFNQIASHLNHGGAVDANLQPLLAENRRLLGEVRASLVGLEAQHGL